MTRPIRFLSVMALFLLASGGTAALIYPSLKTVFMANPIFNGVISAVLLIGIAQVFRTVAMLGREVSWIEDFKQSAGGSAVPAGKPPRLMRPAATMLMERTDRGGRLRLSPTAMQTLLDGVGTRLEDSRETIRYMVGLLVFLGLLGTFWGLMGTISSVSDVIADLNIGNEGDLGAAFANLKRDLQTPLGGMGIAFSSSLFGLAGSLILGFLALQAGRAQNLFYRDFENWLSGITYLGGGLSSMDDQPVPAYIQALLEQTADSLEALQRTVAKTEEGHRAGQKTLESLNGRISTLVETMRTEHDLMLELAKTHKDLKTVLEKLVQSREGGNLGPNVHLRTIESHLDRLVGDLAQGRNDLVQELRNEIRLLARTVAALGKGSSV